MLHCYGQGFIVIKTYNIIETINLIWLEFTYPKYLVPLKGPIIVSWIDWSITHIVLRKPFLCMSNYLLDIHIWKSKNVLTSKYKWLNISIYVNVPKTPRKFKKTILTTSYIRSTFLHQQSNIRECIRKNWISSYQNKIVSMLKAVSCMTHLPNI